MADIIELIQRDHDEIRELLDEIESTPPDSRGNLFRHITAELARHEAAEEAIVHPTLREEGGDEAAADELLHQEQQAEELLAEMEDMDPASDEFLARLRELREDVLAHAQHEETVEHPRLLDTLDHTRLNEMADSFRRVKKTAPTHPHPRVSNAPTAQETLGPIVGMFDRARDAVREALSS